MEYEDILRYFQIEESKTTHPQQWKLHEGLIVTHDIATTLSILKSSNVNVCFPSKDKFSVKFDSTKPKTTKRWFGLINNMGWYAATIQGLPSGPDTENVAFTHERLEEHIYDFKGFLITYEPKFEMEVELPKYLYHVTPKKNLDRITKQGLTPRDDVSKRTYHPPRIYFSDSEQGVIELAKVIAPEDLEADSNKLADRGVGVILKIITSNLPAYFKLFNDPNYKNKGYFTVNNVPPQLIRVVKEVPLTGKKRK